MSTKNELIDVINETRAKGQGVKQIRKQKYAPSAFYMTRTDGKQIGPVKCEGSLEELESKYAEATSYLTAKVPAPKRAPVARRIAA